KKASNNAPLAPLFSAASAGKLTPRDEDAKVVRVIREEVDAAFERTFRVLQTRIDQFGVAQPNINPNKEQGIITVELPGLQDEENGGIVVSTSDTAYLRSLLNNEAARRAFTEAGLSDARFAFGIPDRDANGKRKEVVPFYVLKTGNSEKAPMEGDVITTAAQS